MITRRKKYLWLGILALIIIGGVLFLLVMQLEWIAQAAVATSTELNQSIFASVSQSLDKFHKELQAVYAFLYITPREAEKRNWSDFYYNLNFLAANTQFFDYCKRIYLILNPQQKETEQEVLAYSPEKKVFSPGKLPGEWDTLVKGLGGAGKQDVQIKMERSSILVLVIPLEKEKDAEAQKKPSANAFLIVEIDLARLYKLVFAPYLINTLGKYPFLIRDANQTFFLSPALTGKKNYLGRKPDFVFPVDYMLPFRLRLRELERPPASEKMERPAADSFLYDRFYRYQFFTLHGPAPAREAMGKVTLPPSQLMLEVYYPDGPLDQMITRQANINKLVSISILLLFIISVVLLYRFYVKSDQLREKEQEFVATISHELRTPITVINSTSDNLACGIVHDQERIQSYGRIIRNQVKRLAHMVENILLYSGLQGRNYNAVKTFDWVDLSAIFNDLRGTFNDLAGEKKVSIIFKEEGEGLQLFTDMLLLKLLLENLIMNSILHGVSKTESSEVRVYYRRKVMKNITFVIEDNGPGIPAREKKKVFAPFYRSAYSIRQQIPGSGLGLHLVKKFAELLGGTITLESPYETVTGQLQSGVRALLDLPLDVRNKQADGR